MKIDRLIGILAILLQKELITAPELATYFEVSRRTINRDIEDLCKAGIPVITTQGMGGGIRIMSCYKADKNLFTTKDMRGILAGLRSLDSVSGTKYYSQLMERLKLGASAFISGSDTMLIDLSCWSKERLAPKIEIINDAIEQKNEIYFRYYSPSGESVRVIEPYYLVFKWSSWYVYGYCLTRNDFRMFKLNCMDHIVGTKKIFLARSVQMPDLSNEAIFEKGILLKALFNEKVKWRIIEEYGAACIKENKDGRIFFQGYYSGHASLLHWILSFGDDVEVLEPPIIRQKIFAVANKLVNKYRGEEL